MDESILKKYIVIILIVLINVILIILTCISVAKSINRIEKGEVIVAKTEEHKLNINTEELNEEQDNDYNTENTSFTINNFFNNISKIISFINKKNLQLCILLIIGINLAILSIIIYRKLK